MSRMCNNRAMQSEHDPELRSGWPGSLIRVLGCGIGFTTLDGVDVILTSIELWTLGTYVSFAGVKGPETGRLDVADEANLAIWMRRRRSDPTGVRQAAPSLPGHRLADLQITLADNMGTPYRRVSATAGGSGNEWRAQVAFAPGVPERAQVLILGAVDVDRQAATEVSVRLDR
jgi:hypothetical protein